jgi:uncharacterized protein (TIGR02246 family)
MWSWNELAEGEMSGISQEQDEVIRVQQAKVNSLENGDFEAWLDLHADDVVFVPPGGKISIGKAELREWGKSSFENFDMKDAETVDEVLVSGDLAVIRYSYITEFTPKSGGDATSAVGRGFVVFKRQDDGEWRIARHIWNAPPSDSE